MSTTAKQIARTVARQDLTVTAKLYAIFDALGVGICVDMARTAAASFGLNATSAELAFYRRQAARVA